MRRSLNLTTVTAVAVGGLVAATVAAAPVAADTHFSLSLTGPNSAATGQAVTMQATGTVPSSAFLNRYLNVYALPSSVVSSCPATYQSALQIKDNTTSQGGETVALSVPAEGNFSIPVAWTPRYTGTFLLCGYLHEQVGTDASATHVMTISGSAGGGTVSKPANVVKPKVKDKGTRLVCTRGSWIGDPTRYRYQWRVDGVRKAGATERTLRISSKIRGKAVRCGVTAANAAGSTLALSRTYRVPR